MGPGQKFPISNGPKVKIVLLPRLYRVEWFEDSGESLKIGISVGDNDGIGI